MDFYILLAEVLVTLFHNGNNYFTLGEGERLLGTEEYEK